MAKDTVATIDIGAFIPQDSITFEFKVPGNSEKLTGWKLELCGPGHPQAVAYSQTMSLRSNARQARIEAQRSNGKKVKASDLERDPDDVRAENVGWATSRILGWNPVVIPFIDAKQPTPYSPETALKVFSDPRMGSFLAQLVEVLADEADFTKGSVGA
jgi:hypothetical protein